MNKNLPFKPCDILLPDFSKVDATKWAVIACDQYTSEIKYWQETEKIVGNAPSTLNIILPEIYLKESASRVPKINATMEDYAKTIFKTYKNAVIYTERVQKDGLVKHGVMLAVDLEEYDFSKGSTSLIRATEGTVIERIPPRVEVRKGASIESPHVMLLIDDDKDLVIKPLTDKKEDFLKLYDFELIMGGGSVSGYLVSEEMHAHLNDSIMALIDDSNTERLYGKNAPSKILFAVGDGNHSLATAKTCYENVKKKLGEEVAKNHSSRYALVEVVNLNDSALEFEPIYRVLFNVDTKNVIEELKNYLNLLNGNEPMQTIEVITTTETITLFAKNPVKQLTVGTLQDFIDNYLKTHDGEVDYIHGIDSVKSLVDNENSIGFIFNGMKKSELFKTVIFDGALPRKTFSIGHAYDKRYYLECRKIKD